MRRISAGAWTDMRANGRPAPLILRPEETIMDWARVLKIVEHGWESDILPSLSDYIAIPCQSPAFDPDWAANALLDRAAEHLAQWAAARLRSLRGATVEIVRLEGRTPLLFSFIPGTGRPVLLYGHLDKQPPMAGWTGDHSPWLARREGDLLYGRGSADDGYALYAAVAALLALHDQGLAIPPTAILIEGSEESGSGDLPAYFDRLRDRIGIPDLVVALDAGCLDYDAPWLTTSVRGQVAGTLEVETLSHAVHSGDAAGIAPSSFRIARHLLSRIEDARTGAIAPGPFHAPIPDDRRLDADRAGSSLGAAIAGGVPLRPGTRPVSEDPASLLLNRAWRPQLTVTGLDGLPEVSDAAAVLHPRTRLRLSLRLPPSVCPEAAASALKERLETDPPYGAQVRFEADMVSPGWQSAPLSSWAAAALDESGMQAFGAVPRFFGGGGGIPFLHMLSDAFPAAQYIVTGVLGPGSNAHGPDECLHLPTAKRITAMLSGVLAHAALA
jgi:acetylornithine deacetylase/succinyl-diaminopimelate desuccinylase-like protein